MERLQRLAVWISPRWVQASIETNVRLDVGRTVMIFFENAILPYDNACC